MSRIYSSIRHKIDINDSLALKFSAIAAGAAFVMFVPTCAVAYDTSRDLCVQPRFSSTSTEEANKPNAEIVFYGDSRMESTCKASDNIYKVYSKTLPQAIAEQLGIGYDRIKERARDATSTANLNFSRPASDPQWDVNNYLGDLNQLAKVKVVVLAFGTNDVWYDKQHAINPSGYPAGPLAFQDRLSNMARVALEAGKSVVLVEPYKACDYGPYFPELPQNNETARIDHINRELGPYISSIQAVTDTLSADSRFTGRVARVGLYGGFAMDCTSSGADTSDGLHATQATIIRMAPAIADVIKKFPLVSTSVSKGSLEAGDTTRPTFNWDAKNASYVTVQCTGSVDGAYSGTSLKDAIYMHPVSGGQGTCTVTATNATGLIAKDSQSVTVLAPSISTSISTSTLPASAHGSAVFSWDAKHAAAVDVRCTGSVAGSYSGPSLQNGIYVDPVSVGTGTCTATASDAISQSATSAKTVTVYSDNPSVTSSIDRSTLTLGSGSTIFRWNASDATSVSIRCTGSVAGSYDGPSLQDGIYVQPVSVGPGSCTATAIKSGRPSASSSQSVTVQPNEPSITTSIDNMALTLGGGATIFRWNATNATSVSVRCTGSVAGSYDGSSLRDGIYAQPVSVGNGSCSATAKDAAGKTQTSTSTVTVR